MNRIHFANNIFSHLFALQMSFRGISGITGAALQAKQGPQAAAIGCGGFAAFSLVIDNLMGHY